MTLQLYMVGLAVTDPENIQQVGKLRSNRG
jgi:hypothetical protein